MARPSKAALQAQRVATQRRPDAGPQPIPPAATTRTAAAAPSTPIQILTDDQERSAAQVRVGLDGAPLFDPLLTADQVAQWLGKPKATLYAWRTRGRGPRGIKVGGDLRYRRSDVEMYLDQNTDPRDLD
jgi:predicted DNA-binding transcriptional regulator AlpA